MHIPAPKMPLPGHVESYRPPKEYLLTDEEKKQWEVSLGQDGLDLTRGDALCAGPGKGLSIARTPTCAVFRVDQLPPPPGPFCVCAYVCIMLLRFKNALTRLRNILRNMPLLLLLAIAEKPSLVWWRERVCV